MAMGCFPTFSISDGLKREAVRLLTVKHSIRLCVFILLLVALLSHVFTSGTATGVLSGDKMKLAKIENPENQ